MASLLCDDSIAWGNRPKDEHRIVQELQGVILVPSHSKVSHGGIKDVSGFQAEDMEVPGGEKKLNQKLGVQFFGMPVTSDMMMELKRALILYYREEGFPIVAVEIPKQTVRSGVVQVVVVDGKLGKVKVLGNKYFSTRMLKGYIQQEPGQPINLDGLMNDVAWINRNPFRHADVFFTPGKNEGTTDIELMVKDKFPLRGYAGGDNTGFGPTGNARWFAGFNWGNFFWLDHTLTYQFTMSTDYRRFWAHNFNYNAPLSWRHVLIVFGGYSHIHPHIKDFRSTGHNGQASLRYEIPLKPLYKSFTHDVTFGFDFKNMNNVLDFVANPGTLRVATHEVNLTQLYAGYNLAKNWETNRMIFYAEGFWSPGKWIGDQKNSNFAQLHPGAKNHWVYGRLSLSDTWTLPLDFVLWGEFRGQISNENLVPSEQFGLGGYNTVRGYEERIVNFDDAIVTNVEFRLPSFRLLRFLKKHPDALTFLGFFDYGTGRNAFAESYEQQWQHLIGVGPGLRYKIADYLSVRVDWGFKFHTVQFTHLGSKVHVGVMASY